VRAAATLALLLLAPVAARAADPPGPENRGAISFTLENDLFAGTDRYYTSGFVLAWRSSTYDPPSWLEFLTARGNPLFPEGGTPRWGLAFGQKIFTPADIERRNPDPLDRPYAGWLYGALSLTSYTASQYGGLELQIGVVGPSALGEQTQNNVHDFMNIDRALGWDYQLKDEPGVNLIAYRQWRQNWASGFDGISVGIVPNVAVSLGNVQTYASGGMLFRFGDALETDFGPPRMRPSIAGSAFYQPDRRWGWYAFVGVEGRAVARDIFIEGNTWRESRGQDLESLVGDASIGGVLVTPWARLTMTYTLRSREFTNQRETAQFGSVSVTMPF
jgi:hypothetical protein